MSAFLLALLGAALNAVLPVVVSWVVKILPKPPAAVSGTYSLEENSAYRATVRQWLSGFLAELGQVLVAKGVIPAWLQPELPLVETLVASALNSALDNAGL